MESTTSSYLRKYLNLDIQSRWKSKIVQKRMPSKSIKELNIFFQYTFVRPKSHTLP